MSLSLNYPTVRPTLLLDFINTDQIDPRITFSRASSATYFNSNGILTTAATNALRRDYNPSTLAPQGFLVEEQRTNSIRNNTMQGAVAGTPGTAPTNWTISTATGNLTTREIVGTGTENGITYIDVRFVTSGAFTASVYADTSTGVASLNGQTWTSSFYVKLAGGSLTNVTTRLSIVENNSSGTFLAGADSSAFVPTSAALGTQRFTQTYTNTNAATAFEWSRVKVEFTGAGDVTLRIGLPQLEQGAFATSVIPTTTTALTRSADVAFTPVGAWFNSSAGTLYTEVIAPQTFSYFPTQASLHDGSDYLVSNFSTSAQPRFERRAGGVTAATMNAPPAVSAGATVKQAIAYAVNDFALVANAGTPVTSTSGNVPSVTSLRIGGYLNGVSAGSLYNGYLRRLAYYPVRLANAQLQAITSA